MNNVQILAELLRGKLSDPKMNCEEVAAAFLRGDLDIEAVVRLAHGNNILYNTLSNFVLDDISNL